VRSRWVLRIEPSTSLLYSHSSHQYLRCDRAETFLLTAAATMPVEVAQRVLAREVGDQRARRALKALRTKGLFRRSQRFNGRILELPATAGAFAAPLVAHIGLTGACNFSCRHCYARLERAPVATPDLATLVRLFDQLHDIGCCKVVLGGGEPLLRADFSDVVAAARRRGLDCFVHTNGSLLQRSVIEQLALSPPAGLAVSLDGPDAVSNDAIRGAGAFVAARRGLTLLRRHYRPGFNINFTVTPGNAHLAGRMVDLTERVGARVLLLRPAYPAGQALRQHGIACDQATFAAAVEIARRRAEQRGVDVDAALPSARAIPGFDGFGCVAGRVVLGVAPDGSVTPCLNLPTRFAAGNIASTPLIDIWRRGASFRALRRLRRPTQCRHCEHYASCRGGCRTRALVERGAIGERDSWCALVDAAMPAKSKRSALE